VANLSATEADPVRVICPVEVVMKESDSLADPEILIAPVADTG